MPSEAELLATERLKDQTKLTGDINIDAMKNLQAMLKRELIEDPHNRMPKLEVYDHDSEAMPSFPAIALEYKGTRGPTQRTIGKERATFEQEVMVGVWYYHADVSTKNSASEITKALSRISSIIQLNSDLNGYCRKGVIIHSTMPRDRPVGAAIMAGGCVDISIPVIYRARSAGPG